MATERSDAYITQTDMEGNWDRSAERRPEDFSPEEKQAIGDSNAEKLKERLHGYCDHRGGHMKALPDLPHAVAGRSNPPSPEDLYVTDAWELKRYPRWPGTQDRMVSRSAPLDDVLVYVDESCSDQLIGGDATESEAFCVVVFKPATRDQSSTLRSSQKRGLVFRLESRGPTNELHPQTSDRAVLRAAIAAIESLDWVREGRTQLTIASDSAYLVEGITDDIGVWRQRDWCDDAGEPVANKDLWEKLLSQVNLQAHWGLQVRFWLIDKALNVCAEEMKKHAPINLEAKSVRGLVGMK